MTGCYSFGRSHYSRRLHRHRRPDGHGAKRNETKNKMKKEKHKAEKKNPAAQALGRMGAGCAKTISEEDRAARGRRLAVARARSPHPPKVCACGQPVGSGVGDGLCVECRFAGR